MKIIRTSQEKIDEYFASSALSQSLIKEAEKGVKAFNNAKLKIKESKNENYYNEPSDGFLIGSGVDCIITQGKEVFEEQYYVASEGIAKPSDAIMSIVKAVFDAVLVEEIEFQGLSNHREKILLSVANHNWNTRWSDDVKFNRILTDGTPYWTLLVESRGKIILTLDEYTTINNVADKILDSNVYQRAIRGYLIVIFQLPIYFHINDIECKALLDMVVIDLERGTIKIYDFKTMSGKVTNFLWSVHKFRYDIQGAWYYTAVKERFLALDKVRNFLLANLPTEEFNTLEFLERNFTIDSFSFIVASTTNESQVVKFRMSADLLRIGEYGRQKSYFESFITEEGKLYSNLVPAILGFKSLLTIANRYLYYGLEEDYIPESREILLDWDEIRQDSSDANEE